MADLLKGRPLQEVRDGQQQGSVYGTEVVLQGITLVHLISLGNKELKENTGVSVWKLGDWSDKVFSQLPAINNTKYTQQDVDGLNASDIKSIWP